MLDNEYVTVSLVIGTYTVPNTPEAILRAKDALLDETRAAVIHSPKRLGWELRNNFEVTANTDPNASDCVHDWMIEDNEIRKTNKL